MSLSTFLCTNRSDVHTIFRKLKGWNIGINQYCLSMERNGLLINLQLVGPPIVSYSYRNSYISVFVNSDGTEREMSRLGAVEEIQNQINLALKS